MISVCVRSPKASLFRALGFVLTLSVGLSACGGGTSGGGSGSSGSGGDPQFPQPPAGSAFLTQTDVDSIVQAAAATGNSDTMAIAVVDRLGNILAVWQGPNAPAQSASNFGVMVPTAELAVSLARTAAFFSNDQAPLSSRTVRYISGIHFPPGIKNTANADLYGIENTNRGCILSNNYIAGQQIPPATMIDGTPSHLGVITGKADTMDSQPFAVNPGGVPIFKDNHDVGGIGIAGVPFDVAEFAALNGVNINADVRTPLPLPPPGAVVIGGIILPFVNQTTAPTDLTPSGPFDASRYILTPIASAGPPPDGYLVGPNPGPVGGLTATQVDGIVMNAVNTANQTRASIRLPLGSRAHMMIAVSDLGGKIIAIYRMHDATVFSIDVAATKARNVIYFSGPNRTTADVPGVPMGTAVSSRTISFAAMPFYPPGIDGSSPGPFFSLFLQDVANPCTQGADPPGPPGPNLAQNQSGIVFFPGAVPLYLNSMLVGGLGISGDGVDQDDFVTAGGMVGYEAPANIRADQIIDQAVRLPYLHFPRNPTD